MDAAVWCNGQQILTGLARDKSTACLVNVLLGDRAADADGATIFAIGPLGRGTDGLSTKTVPLIGLVDTCLMR